MADIASVEVRHNALAYLKLAIDRLDEAERLLRIVVNNNGTVYGTFVDEIERFLGSDNRA